MTAVDRVGAAVQAIGVREAPKAWAGTFRVPSTGRTIQLVVPADLTPLEALEIVGFVATELPRELANAAAGSRSRILVPT